MSTRLTPKREAELRSVPLRGTSGWTGANMKEVFDELDATRKERDEAVAALRVVAAGIWRDKGKNSCGLAGGAAAVHAVEAALANTPPAVALRENKRPTRERDEADEAGFQRAMAQVEKVCQQAWTRPRHYAESPDELIADIINERDEARAAAGRMRDLLLMIRHDTRYETPTGYWFAEIDRVLAALASDAGREESERQREAWREVLEVESELREWGESDSQLLKRADWLRAAAEKAGAKP